MFGSDPDLAVRRRLADPGEPGEVQRALHDGRLVRTFSFRGSVQVMAPETAGTYLALRAAGRQWALRSWVDHYRLAPEDWPDLRSVVREPTRTLDELEMHITTLNPHTASHAPHTHPNEEMVIVREGTLQAHVNGREIVVGPGSVLFFASMQPHAVQNVGDGPASYFVINWKSTAGGTRDRSTCRA